jgi:hypothetical protein
MYRPSAARGRWRADLCDPLFTSSREKHRRVVGWHGTAWHSRAWVMMSRLDEEKVLRANEWARVPVCTYLVYSRYVWTDTYTAATGHRCQRDICMQHSLGHVSATHADALANDAASKASCMQERSCLRVSRTKLVGCFGRQCPKAFGDARLVLGNRGTGNKKLARAFWYTYCDWSWLGCCFWHIYGSLGVRVAVEVQVAA